MTDLVAHLLDLGERIKEDARRRLKISNKASRGRKYARVTQSSPCLSRSYLLIRTTFNVNVSFSESTFFRAAIFSLADVTYDVLTEGQWNDFAVMFEDSGFEVYEGHGPHCPEEAVRSEIGAPVLSHFISYQ
ncbi:hypothetical protein V1515DRAFT_583179, partial [Lipomyces mesembrius]